MKERHNRLAVVKELIKNNRIDNQDTLLELLRQEGFNVTQATLSRDLKMLKVGKISDGWSGYYYALPESDLIIRRHQDTSGTCQQRMLRPRRAEPAGDPGLARRGRHDLRHPARRHDEGGPAGELPDQDPRDTGISKE